MVEFGRRIGGGKAFGIFQVVLLSVSAIASGCASPCEPGHCAGGEVCGLRGQCEPEMTSGSESPVGSGDVGNSAQDSLASIPPGQWLGVSNWGTSDGLVQDEVQIGSAQTLYLSFRLPRDASTGWLELHLAEDTTYGHAQLIRIADVTPFQEVDVRRLPGERFAHVARRSSPGNVMRFDVSELVQAADGHLFLAVSGDGASSWSIATPAAAAGVRPRLLVRPEAEDRSPNED